MLMVISPAKTLDFDTPATTNVSSQCDFLDESSKLIKILKGLSLPELARLMDLSDKLASLNLARFASWRRPFTEKNSKQALLAFNGDVYEGLDAKSLSKQGLDRAQKKLRILSGLYGILRPLDLIQPYRLEMGTALANSKGKDLYAFWGRALGEALNQELSKHRTKVVLNLASEEYFKAIQGLGFPVVSPVFQEKKGDNFKVVSFSAKRARGLMARYVLDQGIDDPEALKNFDLEGYRFDATASTADKLYFRRAA